MIPLAFNLRHHTRIRCLVLINFHSSWIVYEMERVCANYLFCVFHLQIFLSGPCNWGLFHCERVKFHFDYVFPSRDSVGKRLYFPGPLAFHRSRFSFLPVTSRCGCCSLPWQFLWGCSVFNLHQRSLLVDKEGCWNVMFVEERFRACWVWIKWMLG